MRGPAWTFCVTNHSRAPKPTRRLPPLSFQTLKAQRPVFATPWVARTPTLDTVRTTTRGAHPLAPRLSTGLELALCCSCLIHSSIPSSMLESSDAVPALMATGAQVACPTSSNSQRGARPSAGHYFRLTSPKSLSLPLSEQPRRASPCSRSAGFKRSPFETMAGEATDVMLLGAIRLIPGLWFS